MYQTGKKDADDCGHSNSHKPATTMFINPEKLLRRDQNDTQVFQIVPGSKACRLKSAASGRLIYSDSIKPKINFTVFTPFDLVVSTTETSKSLTLISIPIGVPVIIDMHLRSELYSRVVKS